MSNHLWALAKSFPTVKALIELSPSVTSLLCYYIWVQTETSFTFITFKDILFCGDFLVECCQTKMSFLGRELIHFVPCIISFWLLKVVQTSQSFFNYLSWRGFPRESSWGYHGCWCYTFNNFLLCCQYFASQQYATWPKQRADWLLFYSFLARNYRWTASPLRFGQNTEIHTILGS